MSTGAETEVITGVPPVTRSAKFDLIPPPEPESLRSRVVASVREYRAALRHCYGMMAEAADAGASVTWVGDECRVTPDNDRARVILGLATGQGSVRRQPRPNPAPRGTGDTFSVSIARGPVYELRAEVSRCLPTAMAFVNDSARRDLHTAWAARDPKFNATRGWLTLQGARGCARFENRGIGIPVATGRPALEGRNLTLRWDSGIGPVRFRLADCHQALWHVWKSLLDKEPGWKLGTVYLTERDGRLSALVTHERPGKVCVIDTARRMEVTFHGADPGALITAAGPDGAATFDRIDAADARAFLTYSAQKRADLEARRGSCGNPRRPWGYAKGWHVAQDTLSRATRQRTEGVKYRNHAWTRRVINRAVLWRCGTIEVNPLPETLHGADWNFSQFRDFLRHKAEECGIALVWRT